MLTRVAGLVMEQGSELCNAAILAREYGIPAIFQIEGATRLLTTGDQGRLDGTSGLVDLR